MRRTPAARSIAITVIWSLGWAAGLASVTAVAVAQAAPGAASDPAARIEEAALASEGPPTPYELATAGYAWRLSTRRGPVRVWAPNGYDPATAATVIYVHGYYVGVDDAWTEHRLPEQFAASHLNALFIVCGAPESPREPVTWPSLSRLLGVVARRVPVKLPAGRTVVVGHSAAHRTLDAWLDERRVDTIALVDAAYTDLSPYRAWLRRSRQRRLIDVASATRRRADRFHRSLPATRVVQGFPPPEAGTLPERVRDARVLYVRASRDHMDLVTDGVALPMVLRALRAPLIGDRPRGAPLAPLPELEEEPDEDEDEDEDEDDSGVTVGPRRLRAR